MITQSNIEKGFAKLNAELENLKNVQKQYWADLEAVTERNVQNIKNIFQNVNLDVTNFRKEHKFGNTDLKNYMIEFQKPGNRSLSGFRLEFTLNPENVTVVDYNMPSNAGKSIAELLDWTNNISAIAHVFETKSEVIANTIHNFEVATPMPDGLRNENEINEDIRRLEEIKKLNDLNLRVGGTYMIATTGHFKRYGYGWEKCTVTKINKKSVLFVIHYQSGHTSDVQGIPLNYDMIRTLEQHDQAYQKKLAEEIARRKRWNPDITAEEIAQIKVSL